MKKYFTHNGTEQKGPFDIEDLKNLHISKDTQIWYEGINEWASAGSIEELKELFKSSSPPPYHQLTPPHIKKPEQKKETSTYKAPEKKRNTGWTVFIIILLVLAIGAVIMVKNNPNSIPGIEIKVNTPKPLIVRKSADGKNSGLFNARTTVYASVMNQGGSGNVLVTFYVYQGSRTYDKTKRLYLTSGQSKDLEMTFEEVDYISGKISYDVLAKSE